MNLPHGFKRIVAGRQPLRIQYGPTFEREARPSDDSRLPFHDSAQFGVQCSGTFLTSAWADGNTSLPTITGRTRAYAEFSPKKLIADEWLLATFSNESGDQKSVSITTIEHAGDLLLIAAFAGTRSMFLVAPSQDGGVTGSSISAFSLANNVSWPRIPAGADLTITFAVRPSVLHRAKAPDGYPTLASIEVFGCLNLFGEQTRE